MIVTIQQPEHLPWLGFFDKMTRCDRFVLLDSVQFKKNYFENRNKILGRQGEAWVNVPVLIKGRSSQLINEVEIAPDPSWKRKYWRSIRQAYSKAPYFKQHEERLQEVLSRDWARLVELNVALIRLLRGILGVETEMLLASEIVGDNNTGSELLLAICKALHATRYISGPDGRRYLDRGLFDDSGIDVVFHDYRHPEYRQLASPFVSHLSVVDLIFNHGDRSLDVLRNEGP